MLHGATAVWVGGVGRGEKVAERVALGSLLQTCHFEIQLHKRDRFFKLAAHYDCIAAGPLSAPLVAVPTQYYAA